MAKKSSNHCRCREILRDEHRLWSLPGRGTKGDVMSNVMSRPLFTTAVTRVSGSVTRADLALENSASLGKAQT